MSSRTPGTTRSERGPLFHVALAVLAVGMIAARGCTPAEMDQQQPEYVMMVGVDVSGSFRSTGHYDNALDFLAHYLYGHLNGLGELRQPTQLFVGPVGGDHPGQAKAFHPIHDFRGKSVEEISASLREWFEGSDRLTDYNAFFRRISELAKRRGLILAPMNIVVLSDGVPDLAQGTPVTAANGGNGASSGASNASDRSLTSAGAAPTTSDIYQGIDLSPLEYLSRSITVRLLYPEAPVAAAWDRHVPRRRVRIWTTDATVMSGWSGQKAPDRPLEKQEALWQWISDNVDYPVRGRLF